MSIKAITSSILFLLLISCGQKSPQQTFLRKYHLDVYDTIVLVSAFSCGGCINDFIANANNTRNKVFVYDSSNHNAFIASLKNHNTVYAPQSAMDSVFGMFGNILLLKKVNGEYIVEELADMQ